MGIKGLTKLLSDNAPNCMSEQKFESYFGRKIAIDASMSIYQFLDWTEQLCTEFVDDHTMRAIQSWASCLLEFLMMQHFSQCVGAVQSLDTDACFCLPIVFSVEDTYPLSRTLRGWSSTSAVTALGCTPDYYASWYSGLDTFHAGQVLRPMPPDRGALPLVLWTPPSSRAGAKRLRI
ncbi:hypothetical protein L7F22_069101 [Adiantum nelumboides]|nr:hypothetical protein [Adiantum nelumboides]